MINSNLGPIFHHFEIRPLIGPSLNLSIKNCGQTSADGYYRQPYRKSPVPYPTVPSPTPYDLPFSLNTSVTDDDNDDGQTDRRTDGRQRYQNFDRYLSTVG